MPTFRGRHLRTSDVVFGLLTAGLLSISGSEIATGRWHSPVPLSVLAALLMFGPVAALSRYPATAAAVSSAALVVESSVYGVPQSLAGFFYLVVLPLALAFYLPRRRWWVGGLVVADAFASTVATMRADGDPPYDLLFTTLISVLAAGAGVVLRDRQRQAREARTESDQLRIEQALRVAEAIAEERGRIARDLHDVVVRFPRDRGGISYKG